MSQTIDNTTLPTVQIKHIVTAPRLSKRSTAFSAGLFVNGKFWGTLSDRGQGGDLIFDPTRNRPHAHLALLDERIAAAQGRVGTGKDLHRVVARLVAHHQARKALATLMTRYVLFFPTGAPPPGARAVLERHKLGWRQSKKLARTQIRADHPACTILNDLSLEDALAAYRRAQ